MADPPSPSGAPLPPPPQINYSLPPPKIFSKPDSSPISNGLIGSSGSVWPPMLPMNKVPDSDKKSDSAPSSSSYDVLLRKTSASWDHPGELGKIRQHVQNTYSPLSSQVLSQEEPGLRVRFGRLYEAVTFYRNGPRDPVLADERYGLEFNLECSQEISEELYPETESEESSSEERESSYFRSYGRSSIHRTMIHDQVRTQAYRRAIQDKRYLFRDKVVLDVGCGTGILSLFAAKAGASMVYAVDKSDAIDRARQIVRDNGMEDTIKVIQGLVEEIVLPVETVDIIISEWMGYCLVYENMLKSVLFARDKWLSRPNGKMFPDVASLFLCGWYSPGSHFARFEWMSDCWGRSLKPRSKTIWEEVSICEVQPDEVGTLPVQILHLPLETCSIEDASVVNSDFCLELVDPEYNIVHGLILYFDVLFRHASIGQKAVLTTSPYEAMTHWKQAVLLFENPITLTDEYPRLVGWIKCFPRFSSEGRGLKIQIQVARENDSTLSEPLIRNYVLR